MMPIVLITRKLCCLQAARTGFSVTARSKAPAIGVRYPEVGLYIADPEATSVVLKLPDASPDVADWEVRVRSEVTGQQLSTPFPFAAVSFRASDAQIHSQYPSPQPPWLPTACPGVSSC